MAPTRRARSARPTAGFSLVEILVAVALLTLIILGLYGMFTQVQRAFRMSMSQVDLLESGRAVTQMVPRELEQITPAGYPYPYGANFCAKIRNSTPLTQPLPGSSMQRTNLLQECFMLLRDNQTWIGIGYFVRTNDSTGHLWLPECGSGRMGVGSLYRYSATLPVVYTSDKPSETKLGYAVDPGNLYSNFVAICSPGSVASTTISNRICDGVVHFQFRAFATNGFPIIGYSGGAVFCTDAFTNLPPYTVLKQVSTDSGNSYPDNWGGLYFWSNAVPAFLELELGILDQRTWERYNAIGVPAAQLAYLQRPDISTRIQLFRQRVPVRNVDPLAYQQ